MVISIANVKGGVGKSTIATNLSCISAISGKETILIDADIQGSSMNFRSARTDGAPQFKAFSILTPTIHKDLQNLKADNVFVDVGSRDNKVFRSGIMAADVVVIPLTPSQFDIWASEDTFKTILEIMDLYEDLKVYLLLNQILHRTNLSRDVMEIIDEFIGKYKFPLLETKLYSRIAYKESTSDGLSVVEIKGSKFEKAAGEMKNLYDEIIQRSN